ncbi:gamma-glutamyl-gamma-aminobutyraldehyde dehydrogenase [Escherichia coli]|uniref:Gamma-glutamyl-gamma-aminobutyraldehyde dehydrogenase n=1 Tax=Escherichia coli TaxID=562 RepID=A0A376VIQ9_ECOLX|nr:gamma-glutamyl-gamma-aminobutyraldehyde dehydrogenase [Escherichia coli]
MNFHHLAYWQDKALSLAIETRLFINGEYTAAAENETFETVDPVTQAPLANIARGKSVDIDRAVSAARGVFERGDWSLSSPAKRKAVLNKLADLMEANAEELALLETLDTGKPIRHSLRDDIPGAARAIRWYTEAIDKVYGEVATTSSHELAMIVREPVGVIAAIVPWNFPLLLTCWKLGPALAAGNSVILKPSEKSPLSAIRLAGLAKEAGLPDGVLNVVTGFGHEAGQALSRHNDIDAIAFTGSTRTGETAAERCRRQQHETRLAGSGRQKRQHRFSLTVRICKKRRARPLRAFSTTRGRCVSPERACCWKRASPMNS